LFLIYIYDLPNCLLETTPCMNAYDTQIFTSCKDPNERTNKLNNDLENICEWLTANKLQFHPSKTKSMIIGSSYNLAKIDQCSVFINNTEVTRVKSQKCLGIKIDDKLNWGNHIDKFCKKAGPGIGAIRRLKPFVPRESIETMYKALVQPYFDYCSPLW
ncbi:predicted protein, partial [Nematostella vectensis]